MSVPRLTLAEHLRRRRGVLRLTVDDAVAATVPPGSDRRPIWRQTWQRWERRKDPSIPHARHFVAIERAMRWKAGSVEAILAGGEPAEHPADPSEWRDPDTNEVYTDSMERSFWQMRRALAQPYIARGWEVEAALYEGRNQARAHIAFHRAQTAMAEMTQTARPGPDVA